MVLFITMFLMIWETFQLIFVLHLFHFFNSGALRNASSNQTAFTMLVFAV